MSVAAVRPGMIVTHRSLAVLSLIACASNAPEVAVPERRPAIPSCAHLAVDSPGMRAADASADELVDAMTILQDFADRNRHVKSALDECRRLKRPEDAGRTVVFQLRWSDEGKAQDVCLDAATTYTNRDALHCLYDAIASLRVTDPRSYGQPSTMRFTSPE